MTIVWGVTLAAGLLLAMSPWIWPRRPRSAAAPRRVPALARLVESAGMPSLPVRLVVVASGVLAAVGAAIAWLLLPLPVLALLAALVGAALPIAYLRARAGRLVRTRRALWPDVCDLLIASVRAGMPLADAVASLATSAPAPLRPAFASFARDLAASGNLDTSLDRLRTTLADAVADRIVATLRMARQVGGTQLVPVLRSLGASVRADATLRAEVEARQSWVRGAAVLAVIAPWAVLALLALRPEGARAYASPEGVALIVGGAVATVVAAWLMTRIARLPAPRRWSS
ncbi:type II secretion system F family protein [Microbacterium sp. X-17]|uniref:type II secretion system F family protein n=1 Tax=Microbacterium sp. X-17 TaxID=3144404 RepID=UPI0031F4B06D